MTERERNTDSDNAEPSPAVDGEHGAPAAAPREAGTFPKRSRRDMDGLTRAEKIAIWKEDALARGLCGTCRCRPHRPERATCEVCAGLKPASEMPGVPRQYRRRDPKIPRPKSVRAKLLTRAVMEAFDVRAYAEELAIPRPRKRAECCEGPRPCPFVGCRHHLYLEVSDSGSIRIAFPHLSPDQLTESCSLDVADRGPQTLESIAVVSNVTRERVRQIEVRALINIKPRTKALGAR